MDPHRIFLGIVVLGVLVTALLATGPNITGFVPTDTVSQNVDLEASQSQRFILSGVNESVTISSFSVSGEVIGSGVVNVYLSDGNREWLVFTNQRERGTAMESITGLSTLSVQEGEKLDRIESLDDELIAVPGAFQSRCVETCSFDSLIKSSQLFLDVVVEPGTAVRITQITFSQ